MVALFVVGHLFLLLVVFHVLLRSRRYAPRVVLRYASAGRGWAAETPVLRESGRGHEYCGDHNSEDSELHISLRCLPRGYRVKSHSGGAATLLFARIDANA